MKRIVILFLLPLTIFVTAAWYFNRAEPKMVMEPKTKIPEAPAKKSMTKAEEQPLPKSDGLLVLVDRGEPIQKRITPDMSSRYPSVSDPQDFAALDYVLRDTQDDDTARNEVANLLRRSKYPQLPSALMNVLGNSDEKPRFRAFAAQHLGELLPVGETDHTTFPLSSHQRVEIIRQLETLLEDRHTEVRREALLALTRRKDPFALQLAAKWLKDDSLEADDVRDLAIRCVSENQMRELMPVVRKYSKHPNEVVRIAAIVALSQWRDEESLGAFEEAAKSPSVRLQRAGKLAIAKMKQVAQP